MSAIAASGNTSLNPPQLKSSLSTGYHVRAACRAGTHFSTTASLAPIHLQANLIVLPSRYAADFRLLCARNPVPCPVLAESTSDGRYDSLKSRLSGISGDSIASDVDIRKDAPKYVVYRDSVPVKEGCADIVEEWTEDHVAFLIGCSFSFETALTTAGLTPRHITMGMNVPIYRTNIPLCPAGVFNSGTYVVSMRPYKREHIEKVRDITRPYLATHGEPLAWGWDDVTRLGIMDINKPEWGEPPLDSRGISGLSWGDEDEIPVFWGCGVTPQEAVMRAGLKGTVMAHEPGCMLVLDCPEEAARSAIVDS